MVSILEPFGISAAFGAALIAGCGGEPFTSDPPDAEADGTGAVAVEAGLLLIEGPYTCPGIASFSINPASLAPQQAAQLEAITVGPTPSLVQWTANPVTGGNFSDSGSLTPTFLCTGAGHVVVTVKVGVVVPNEGNVCDGV